MKYKILYYTAGEREDNSEVCSADIVVRGAVRDQAAKVIKDRHGVADSVLRLAANYTPILDGDRENVEQVEYRSQAHIRADRRLGKAVHPKKLEALYRLYPDVEVYVRHEDVTVPYYCRRYPTTMYTPAETQKVTRVTFKFSDKEGNYVWAEAKQHEADQWVRREGIKIAFNRAFKLAEKRHQREQWWADASRAWAAGREAPVFA